MVIKKSISNNTCSTDLAILHNNTINAAPDSAACIIKNRLFSETPLENVLRKTPNLLKLNLSPFSRIQNKLNNEGNILRYFSF